MLLLTLFLGLIYTPSAATKSFLAVISSYPQLSNFTSFYLANFPVASLLLTNSSTNPRTVLVPNNDAFVEYETVNSYPVTSIPVADLEALIRYHTLVGRLTAANFSQPRGLTAPSWLVGEQYNNRSAGAALTSSVGGAAGASGQVVFISPGLQSSGNKFLVRQLSPNVAIVTSGLGSQAALVPLDAEWDGGYIQEVDRFLNLPGNCADTVRDIGLTFFDTAINRTNLWGELNTSPNYTCLGPTNQAFVEAGNLQNSPDSDYLHESMEGHTIPQPLYTNFLEDGQFYMSDNNATIRISLKGNDIYFNNAKVVNANVITNNGVIHILDQVMLPIEETNSTSTTTAITSQSATSTASATSKTGAASSSGNGNPFRPNDGISYLYFALFASFVLSLPYLFWI